MDVRLRAGVLELQDLTINAAAINEHLVGQPFRLKRGTIKGLRVTICYEKILSESFTLSLEGVELELVPANDAGDGSPSSTPRGSPTPLNEPRHSPSPPSSMDSTSRQGPPWPRPDSGFIPPNGVPYELRGAGLEDADELDIIAEWIQLIKSRIKVSVRDLKLRLYEYDDGDSDISDSDNSEQRPTCICVMLYSAMYYDKTPDHFATPTGGPVGLGSSTMSASVGPSSLSSSMSAPSNTGTAVPFGAGASGACVSHKVCTSSKGEGK